MILYNPHDGVVYTSPLPSNPRTCFLMTRLGSPVPSVVEDIRNRITDVFKAHEFEVIDANRLITGKDYLTKIWNLIASAPIAVAICHDAFTPKTQGNIFYELGVAQALGKETLLIKTSKKVELPSDFVRSEYVVFDGDFERNIVSFIQSTLAQAEYFEIVADQLDRNPILAIDYLKRAYLITGKESLKAKAQVLLATAGIENRARNSVEVLAAAF